MSYEYFYTCSSTYSVLPNKDSVIVHECNICIPFHSHILRTNVFCIKLFPFFIIIINIYIFSDIYNSESNVIATTYNNNNEAKSITIE